MIELHIDKMAKGFSPKEKWQFLEKKVLPFSTVGEAKDYLRRTYRKCKRVECYRDLPDGGMKQTGYVFEFHNADQSHYPVVKWIQQDWVEFRESKLLDIEKR